MKFLVGSYRNLPKCGEKVECVVANTNAVQLNFFATNEPRSEDTEFGEELDLWLLAVARCNHLLMRTPGRLASRDVSRWSEQLLLMVV